MGKARRSASITEAFGGAPSAGVGLGSVFGRRGSWARVSGGHGVGLG